MKRNFFFFIQKFVNQKNGKIGATPNTVPFNMTGLFIIFEWESDT